MKKTKTQKGITLIALIITIIVLLILAVVSIREIQGDGIISKARQAAADYNQAQINEIDKMSEFDALIATHTGDTKITAKTIQNNLKDYFGKCVNYGIDINGSEDTTNNSWRIFCADDTNIYLINIGQENTSYSPIPDNVLDEYKNNKVDEALPGPTAEIMCKCINSGLFGENRIYYKTEEDGILFSNNNTDFGENRVSGVNSELFNIEGGMVFRDMDLNVFGETGSVGLWLSEDNAIIPLKYNSESWGIESFPPDEMRYRYTVTITASTGSCHYDSNVNEMLYDSRGYGFDILGIDEETGKYYNPLGGGFVRNSIVLKLKSTVSLKESEQEGIFIVE